MAGRRDLSAWALGPKLTLRALLVRLGLFVAGDVWAIALYEGPSPYELAPLSGRDRPRLTARDVHDVDAQFVADPFMQRSDGGWHMFFEVMNRTSGRGEVGLASSPDGRRWRYEQVVLAEPYHLSYPYMFSWEGEHYLVPETSTIERVLLYRARRYPFEWEVAGVLLEGMPFNDTSIFRHAGRWWMLTETARDFRSDTLRLYLADEVAGAWKEHPASPLVQGDAVVARPAGRVVVHDGHLVRFAQDCSSVYGARVHAFMITDLSPSTYAEHPARVDPVLDPPAYGWNNLGMHHVDAHPWGDGRWLACVDGRPAPGLRWPPWLVHSRPRSKAAPRRT